MAQLSWRKFFQENQQYNFYVGLGPFHCKQFKKIFTADQELGWYMCFVSKMVHKMYLFIPFIRKDFNIIVRVGPELWQHVIFETKRAQLTCIRIFFLQNFDVNPGLFDCARLYSGTRKIKKLLYTALFIISSLPTNCSIIVAENCWNFYIVTVII